MPLRIRSHITYPEKPKPASPPPKRNRILNTLFTPWSPREDAVLRSSYETVGPTKIGEKLGRSAGAVKQRYIKLQKRAAA